ncbi:MAG: hypothetical protein MIN69_02590 [Methylorubrum extorquens]|jgi:hypothetical protein|uniref:hypothetical protein n=1 Tax=Methylorubrum extorquens TaxID=408 RepID=UPI00138B0D2E|nr:hypothetical protein [Methylorubrum extorquens]MCG5244343.1 hypothetical protein [Methylorubrum extorquens]
MEGDPKVGWFDSPCDLVGQIRPGPRPGDMLDDERDTPGVETPEHQSLFARA